MKIQNKKNIFYCFLFIVVIFYQAILFAAENDQNIVVNITGVDKTIEENIRSSLNTFHEQTDFEDNPSFISQYKQHTRQEVQLALQPYGYYASQVEITLNYVNKQWVAEFTIVLNEPIRITHVHFSLIGAGEQDPAFASLIDRFPLKDGDILNHECYEKGKKELLTPVIEAGYLNAMFIEHRVEVDVEENTAVIYLTLETGTLHHFGTVTYENTVLSPKFLDRYLGFECGDVYSPEKVLSLQSKLSSSDYFSEVNVKPLIDENSETVPLTVELKDAKPNQYLLGIGFGTDTGIRGRAGWLRRRVNSLGHQFLAEARLSEIYTKLEADYIIPGKRPETDTIKIRGGYFEDQFNDQPSRIHEATIMEDRQLGKWQRKISFGFVEEAYPAFVTYETIRSQYILPSITFTQIIRDNPAAPKRGRRIDFNLRGSTLLDDINFIQADLQAKWLHPVSETVKILTRLELGATAPNNVEKVPLSQRFYTGGDTTLRGYAYRSLPLLIDKNGNFHPAGGSYIAVGSFEVVKTIKKPFGISAFIDAGNAFREDANIIAAGPGVGIEWQTPFGPLKVAVAKPLTANMPPCRFHVIFGPEI